MEVGSQRTEYMYENYVNQSYNLPYIIPSYLTLSNLT